MNAFLSKDNKYSAFENYFPLFTPQFYIGRVILISNIKIYNFLFQRSIEIETKNKKKYGIMNSHWSSIVEFIIE